MPELLWEGKSDAVAAAKAVPYRLLEADDALSYGEANTENMLIQGDNLATLKALLPYYKGSVRCIYADPPYLLQTRSGKQYQCEMSDADHEELLEALLRHRGAVMLSGYHSDMYDSALRGWSVAEWRSYNQNSDRRTEVLWCNFELPQMQLADKEENDG